MGVTSLAKTAFWKSPYWFRIAGLYAQYMLVKRRLARRRIADLGLPYITRERLERSKRGDTVFVLGSGASINRIAPARWDAIRRHDSIGLNFWLFHAVVPTIFYFEVMEDHEQDLIARFARLADSVADRYRATLKIASEFQNGVCLFEALGAAFRDNLYAHVSIPMFVDTDAQLETSLRLLKWAGVFQPGGAPQALFKHAGSVSAVVSLAIKMGYRRIVLCGIDLASPAYFFHDTARYPQAGAFQSVAQSETHDTAAAGLYRCAYPADKVLVALEREILDPLGIEIFVEDESSALHPDIPIAPDTVWTALGARA